KKIPRWMLILTALALFGANSVNIGADLFGMADAAEMLSGLNSHLLILIFGIGIAFWTVRCSYDQIAAILKWLALCLFAYVVTAFVVKPNWSRTVHDTFVPAWPKDHATWQTLVAILGTTISPYLFSGNPRRRWKPRKQWAGEWSCKDETRRARRSSIASWMWARVPSFPISSCTSLSSPPPSLSISMA